MTRTISYIKPKSIMTLMTSNITHNLTFSILYQRNQVTQLKCMYIVWRNFCSDVINQWSSVFQQINKRRRQSKQRKRCFHTFSCENCSETKMQLSQKWIWCLIAKMRRWFVVNETRGVGIFLGQIKKNELAANNGDTLGEAVISVKSNEFISGKQRKIRR